MSDELRNPGGVSDVGLSARDVAQMLRVEQPALKLRLEQRVDWLPVDAGRLHSHKRNRVARKPVIAIKRYSAIPTDALPWLFISERGQSLTRQTVNYLIAETAGRAGLPPVHPHMLRHSCGFALANRG